MAIDINELRGVVDLRKRGTRRRVLVDLTPEQLLHEAELEAARIRARKWRKANPGAHKDYKAKWQRDNPTKAKGYKEKLRLQNPERHLAQKRVQMLRHRKRLKIRIIIAILCAVRARSTT